jgi:hypothetical protein
MQYTTIDGTATTDEAKKQLALQAEMEAYTVELEDKRLAELEKSTDQAVKDAAKEARKGLKKDEKRAKADTYTTEAALDPAVISEQRVAHVNGYIRNLEREYASHVARLALLDAENAPVDDPARAESSAAMSILDSAHAIALAEMVLLEG